MGLEPIKLELIEWISKLKDIETIKYLKSVKDSKTIDANWWDSLSDAQKTKD